MRRSRSAGKSKFSFPILLLLIMVSFSSFYYYVYHYLPKEYESHNKTIDNKLLSKTKELDYDFNPVEKKDSIVLSFAGDCTIGSDPNFTYNTFHQKYEAVGKDPAYFFSNMKKIFSNDDLTIVNFEGTLTNATQKAQKKFTFKGPPEYAKILSSGSIELVNLSNNHSYDFLQKGLDDTISALKDESIPYFGLGTVHKVEINNIPVAFLGYLGWQYSVDLEKMEKTIQALKEEGNIVIVNYHWGLERHYTPSSTQTTVAHRAIDAGADFIIGHHPHVIQSMEIYKDRLIMYSLGNFCFGGNSNPRDKRSMVVQLMINKNDNGKYNSYFRILPATISSVDNINDFKPTLISDEEKKETYFDFLNSLSPDVPFEITDDYTNLFYDQE